MPLYIIVSNRTRKGGGREGVRKRKKRVRKGLEKKEGGVEGLGGSSLRLPLWLLLFATCVDYSLVSE